ncbi:ubiquitin-protein ligase Anaphase Promoting Complex [Coelomomyces lativittatus]|nr:ubiquitin-protein ligase Anaphase Promoting Complex [Coelomomyces lativittatus]KAJ1512075.1 ubiquitin-protein ligase Anaphase Promoting Complex [Coelomomyces lativittatus]
MQIKIKKWKAVASWHWNADRNEVCGICQNEYENTCGKCRFAGDECPLLWGQCGHVFHFHCITRWLQEGRTTCPLDRTPWETARASAPKSPSPVNP